MEKTVWSWRWLLLLPVFKAHRLVCHSPLGLRTIKKKKKKKPSRGPCGELSSRGPCREPSPVERGGVPCRGARVDEDGEDSLVLPVVALVPLHSNVPWFRGGLVFDSCITQLKAQGPSRTCNESKEEDEVPSRGARVDEDGEDSLVLAVVALVRAGRRDAPAFRGGLVFKAHRLSYHSTLGLGVTKRKKHLPSRRTARVSLQGYLAHKKTSTPLRPP